MERKEWMWRIRLASENVIRAAASRDVVEIPHWV